MRSAIFRVPSPTQGVAPHPDRISRAIVVTSALLGLHCGGANESPPRPATEAPKESVAVSTPPAPAVCPDGAPITVTNGKVVTEVGVGPAKLGVIFDTGAVQSVFSSRVPGLVRGKPVSFEFVGRKVEVNAAQVNDRWIETLRRPEFDAVGGLAAVDHLAVRLD
jgi:hypothetical protein